MRVLLPLLLSACCPLAGPAPMTGMLAVDWHGAILLDGRAIRCDVDGRTVSVVWDGCIVHFPHVSLSDRQANRQVEPDLLPVDTHLMA